MEPCRARARRCRPGRPRSAEQWPRSRSAKSTPAPARPTAPSGAGGTTAAASSANGTTVDTGHAGAGRDRRTLGSSVAEVALGMMHSCARKTDGTLWCWGHGGYGQLGGGSIVFRTRRYAVQAGTATLGSSVADVALGQQHSCARKTDGTLWCWGDNSWGQLGDGTNVYKAAPVQAGVAALGRLRGRDRARRQAHAARARPTAPCGAGETIRTLPAWLMATGAPQTLPVQLTGLRCDANDAICGINEAQASSPADCRTSSCGDEKCDPGETVQGCPTDCKLVPSRSRCGAGHSCARKTDGTLWCWGPNNWASSSDGTTIQHVASADRRGDARQRRGRGRARRRPQLRAQD
jgi:hypothetical protein